MKETEKLNTLTGAQKQLKMNVERINLNVDLFKEILLSGIRLQLKTLVFCKLEPLSACCNSKAPGKLCWHSMRD